MEQYQSGELVLVAFLFTGATEYKRRPALILLDTGDEDIIVARVTTQKIRTDFDLEIVEWEKAGLRRPSAVRLHKMNTLEKRLIERRLGRLDADDWGQVRKRIQQIWSLL